MLQPFLHVLNAQRIVLASSSPRRKEILENVGLQFEVIPSTFEENVNKSLYPLPKDYVLETARLKVEEVASKLSKSQNPPDLIIGADTVVSQHKQIIEKPKDKNHAFQILSDMSGTSHEVITGVILAVPKFSSVLTSGQPLPGSDYRYTCFAQNTEVFFYPLTEEVINSYIATGESFDKAGGYGIQTKGGTLVEKIEGDYFNVMGFPLPKFAKEMADIYANVR